jgi:putative sigma-54 modulation protein
MKTLVTFKNIKSSEPLRDYVHEKLSRFDRLLDKPATASVVFRKEKIEKVVEISFTSGSLELHAKESHPEMQGAIDLALDKLKKQLTSAKEKARAKRTRNSGVSLGERLASDTMQA